MIRRPPRSTLSSSSAASDVYKRQKIDSAVWRYKNRKGMSLADKLDAVLYVPEAAMPAARDLKHMHKVADVRPGRGAEQIDDEGLVWLG